MVRSLRLVFRVWAVGGWGFGASWLGVSGALAQGSQYLTQRSH